MGTAVEGVRLRIHSLPPAIPAEVGLWLGNCLACQIQNTTEIGICGFHGALNWNGLIWKGNWHESVMNCCKTATSEEERGRRLNYLRCTFSLIVCSCTLLMVVETWKALHVYSPLSSRDTFFTSKPSANFVNLSLGTEIKMCGKESVTRKITLSDWGTWWVCCEEWHNFLENFACPCIWAMGWRSANTFRSLNAEMLDQLIFQALLMQRGGWSNCLWSRNKSQEGKNISKNVKASTVLMWNLFWIEIRIRLFNIYYDTTFPAIRKTGICMYIFIPFSIAMRIHL